jgi:hypothetical protein
MASELKVDKIFNAGGDQDSGINLATNDTIKFDIATSTKATMASTGIVSIVGEGGTTTTNLQQGLVKHWCNLQADGFSINDSFNNASCTDNGNCNYDYTYTNAFANNDMCPSGFVKDGSTNAFVKSMQSIDGSNFSTTTINVTPVAVNAGTLISNFDPNHCCISIVGDLA